MDLTALTQPIAEAAPCGPDLWDAMDPEFDDYYTAAQNRMPGYYAQPGVQRPDGSVTPDKLFDAATVNIAEENKQIDALLARTRDLRLLSLRARWEALAGHLPALAEATDAMALLLETFPEAVHPQGVSDRREAIGELNDLVSMVQAVQFAPLNGSTEVTLRKLKVARGEMSPLQSETDLDARLLQDALADPARRDKVDETHGSALRLAEALSRIERACQSHSTPFAPPLKEIKMVVGDLVVAISEARPDLRGADGQTLAPKPAPAPALDAPMALVQPASAKTSSGEGPKVLSSEHARRLLAACEVYYSSNEPSSAALLVVAQARLLIGKPLIEAIAVLMPETAGKAAIDFGPSTGFSLNAAQLKMLSDAAPEGQPPGATDPAPHAPVPRIATAQEAADVMRAVEDYFRQVECSSPVPMLLQRARSYLNRDFQSLINELIPQQ